MRAEKFPRLPWIHKRNDDDIDLREQQRDDYVRSGINWVFKFLMEVAQKAAAWVSEESADIEFRIPAADLHESPVANPEKIAEKLYFK